jgi:virulence-associated protein VagC
MTTTAELLNTDQGQVVRLPDEFQMPGSRVSIRREGDAVVLEPLKGATWPPGFFEAIRIEDSAFQRPDQGELPPLVELG